MQQNISLKKYNTFGIDVKAKRFQEVSSVDELKDVLKNAIIPGEKLLILGGGSNILLTGDFQGLVIRNLIKGIEVIKEDADHIYIRSGAGEVWHEFVLYCIEHGYAGVENLSLIPGSVGAGPMQNIGAYGVELKDVFHELEALHIDTLQLKTFSHADCKFGYRESVFKNEVKGQYLITSVTFRLNKKPVFHTNYGAIQQELEKQAVKEISIRAISDAVIAIRKSKLPDPAVLGNAGSFFKNPEVPVEKYEELKENYPSIPGYPTSPGRTKLAAGWLIEQCGWKGKVVGHTGSHKDQALVLVNYGGATGNEIYALALEISRSVQEKFGVTILPEVNVI